VSPLSSVIVQVLLGRSNRRSVAWRLAGGSSPRRANFLNWYQGYSWIGSRDSVEDHMEIRGLCIYKVSCNVHRYGAGTVQGGACDRGWSCGRSTIVGGSYCY
jgi:hypothetical protein